MPHPNETPDEAQGLEKRLQAAEAAQAREASGDNHRAMAQGYRFLGEVVGGVFMGSGLGWLLDRFAGTTPFGLVGGLLIGTGFTIFVAVKSAARMSRDPSANAGPPPSVPGRNEDED